jgi:uncharacterized protein
MNIDIAHGAGIAALGLVAGIFGGLAGVGGSMVMLPGLHLLLGDPRLSTHHLYMAGALVVNVLVALPAAWRHGRSGTVRKDLLPTLLSTTLVAVVIGVLCSNLFKGSFLKVVLAGFIAAYCVFNLLVLARGWFGGRSEPGADQQRIGRGRLLACGTATGFTGGLLGLGGGVLLVPLLQMVCRLPLKQAIATSSAVIWISAMLGATVKLSTLSGEGERWTDALVLVAVLGPGAVAGGIIGAMLTQRLKTRTVRVVVTLLLMVAAAKLAELW